MVSKDLELGWGLAGMAHLCSMHDAGASAGRFQGWGGESSEGQSCVRCLMSAEPLSQGNPLECPPRLLPVAGASSQHSSTRSEPSEGDSQVGAVSFLWPSLRSHMTSVLPNTWAVWALGGRVWAPVFRRAGRMG